MKIIGVLLAILFCLTACRGKQEHNGKTPLVEVSGEFLYKEDLQAVLPPNLSKDDSLLFAEHYIKNWVEGVLLFNKAESNIPDSERINELAENYRKALIVHTYQQELIDQRLSRDLTEQEMTDYYNSNKELFVLESPLIKGLYIKIPVTAPGLNNVRNWYKKNTQQNAEALDKYSLQNAVNYDYFYDRWLPVSEVMDKIPLKIENMESFLERNKSIEVKDSAFFYFLNIDAYLKPGEAKPYEYAKKEIKDMLMNLKRVSFIRDVKNDLYNDAANRKKIIYYY